MLFREVAYGFLRWSYVCYQRMVDLTKLKYKVNYNHYTYNFKTKRYESKEATYSSYEQARANQWKCEKCYKLFATLKQLRLHKLEYHSY